MAFVQRFIVRYPAMSVSMQSPCIATRINIRWRHSNKRVPEKYILLSQWKTDIKLIKTFVQRFSTQQCRFPCNILHCNKDVLLSNSLSLAQELRRLMKGSTKKCFKSKEKKHFDLSQKQLLTFG